MPRLRSGLFAACFAARLLLAADAPLPTRDPLTDLPINPALQAYAGAHAIPLQGIDRTGADPVARPGDEVILLLALQQPAGFDQWLVRLRYEKPDANRGENRALPEDRIYTSTGLDLHYPNSPAALEVEFIGPFPAATSPQQKPAATAVKTARAVVSAESLRQGMAEYARSSLEIRERLQAAGIANPKYFGSSNKLSAAETAAGREAAAAFQLSPAEERLAFSVVFSLRSFFMAASGIPACADLMEKVIQKPSLWSLATNLGLNTNFKYGWHHVQAVPADRVDVSTPAYFIPVQLSLNDRLAVKATFVATLPQPPLQTSAGILAICAEHPTDDTKRLFIRVLSARRTKTDAAAR